MAGRKQQVLANVSGVDWKLLRKQKARLLMVIGQEDERHNTESSTDLTGILHLVDHIQDEAALTIAESTVFGRSRK